MTTTINASTSTGLVTTADTSGVLQLQTGGTAAVTIGTDQSVNFSATGQRITGDFSNATVANRVMFQTSTVNGATRVEAIPNGTGTTANFAAYNNSDPTNAAAARLTATASETRVESTITGTGTYLPMTFYTGGSERVRIDTSGNVGIGMVPSGDSRLEVYGADSATIYKNSASGTGTSDGFYVGFAKSSGTDAYVYNRENANLIFGTNNSERVRIDSSGNLLVGKTATTIGTVGTVISSSRVQVSNAATTSADDGIQIYSTGASAYRFFVGMGGQINATSTSITAISDVSLKENVRDLETGLSEVLQLKPRRFDWKEETQLEQKNIAGFIAQELEEVLPDLVYEYKYSDTETKKSIKMGDILPTLVKAIQEQQALITQLQADVAALKGAQP